MSAVKLTLPLPENLGNARMHWRVKLKAKKQYWERLNLLRYTGQLPKPPRRPLDPATIRVTFYVWNRMDDSNAMARLKWVEDWLVAHEYIRDDSRKHLRYAGLPEQHIDRKDPRLELELTTTEQEG